MVLMWSSCFLSVIAWWDCAREHEHLSGHESRSIQWSTKTLIIVSLLVYLNLGGWWTNKSDLNIRFCAKAAPFSEQCVPVFFMKNLAASEECA